MKKRTLIIIALLCVFVVFFSIPWLYLDPIDTWGDTLYACNGRYRIRIDSYGRYYICKPLKGDDGNLYDFSSVTEMIANIRAGYVHTGVFHSRLRDPETGRIYIHDLSRLYNAVLPEECNIYTIYWSGDYYQFYFDDPGSYPEKMSMMKVEYDTVYSSAPEDDSDAFKVHADGAYRPLVPYAQETIDYRNATAEFYYSQGNYKNVRIHLVYTLQDENKTVYVRELYNPEISYPGADANNLRMVKTQHYDISEETPTEVLLYCTQGDISYKVRLFPEHFGDLSEEYLLSFGLEPYVEAET